MKKCPVCNNELKDDAKFCPHCGTNLVKDKKKIVDNEMAKKSTLAFAGMLLSIVSLVWSFSAILALISLVLLMVAKKDIASGVKQGIKYVKIGTVIAVITIILKIVFVILDISGVIDLASLIILL